MLRSRGLAVLAGLSLLAGFALPWVSLSPGTARGVVLSVDGGATHTLVAHAGLTRTQKRSAATPRRAVALGGQVIATTAPCLAERGIDLYPESVDTPEELLRAISNLQGRRTAVIIHTGERTGLVDGQIRQVLDVLGPERRVVWATIQIPDPAWGEFTFEDRTNASIRNVVRGTQRARVLDWNALSRAHPHWTSNGLDPSDIGCAEYARKAVKLSGLPRPGQTRIQAPSASW